MIKERAISNKVLLSCWNVTVTMLMAAYLIEVLKQDRTWTYFIMLCAISMLPMIFADVLYVKNNESPYIKYIAAYGYSFFFAVILFTGNTALSFVYIFPLLSALIVCNDYKLMRNFALVNIALNILSVIYFTVSENSVINMTMAEKEIQVIGSSVILVCAYIACKNSILINEKKQEAQAQLLEDTLSLAAHVKDNVDQIYDEMQNMSDSVNQAECSIQEIAAGILETDQSVQQQVEMTGDIQNLILNEVELSTEINDFVEETKWKVDQSIDNMAMLQKTAANADENSQLTKNRMLELNKRAKEVQRIVSIIDDIAFQTDLLALNASIEASRAGAAGKGFSIVASEITNLAAQTKVSTDNIAQIIEKLQEETSFAVSSVEEMTNISQKQSDIIHDTERNFKQIADNIVKVYQDVNHQKEQIEEIKENNLQIVSSTERIASFNEQVTRNSEKTVELTAENRAMTDRVKQLVENVVDELKRFE